MNTTGKRVLIIGAGSGGLSAAVELGRLIPLVPGMEVTLVDCHNYHLFLPLLYQVATGGVDPGHICFPIRGLLKSGGASGPIMFRESLVSCVDLDGRTVQTDKGVLEWDYLVFAPGSTTNFFGRTDLEQNTLTLKSLRDGIVIHNRIISSFEVAVLEPDEQRRRELLTFVIVGGGATGVELTASMNGFVRGVLPREFPPLEPLVRVVLVEAGDRILKGMLPGMCRVSSQRLKSMGVELVLGSPIVHVSPEAVQMSDGRVIRSRNVIWVAGVRPSPLAEALPLEKARDGRVKVTPTLEAEGHAGVYIIGDCAYLERLELGVPYPPTGQMAVRHGKSCAMNIVNSILGRPQQPFHYEYKGELISMGRNVAVAHVGRLAFDGLGAWLLWRVYYLRKLMGFRNRFSVAIDWAFDYFHRRNTARLDIIELEQTRLLKPCEAPEQVGVSKGTKTTPGSG